MLKLPNVTLVAFGSEKYKEAHQKALDYSCRGIEFGAVKNITQECNGIDAWNRAVIYDLPKHIETEFCILIHADGFIIHPEMWNPDWLNYDYIGAPWPMPNDDFSYRDIKGEIIRVGNSVSLRSKRLMDLANDLNLEWKPFHGFYNEDGFICVNYRHKYLEAGMKFAPIEVAKYFSKEHDVFENADVTKTFAFHAL